MKTKVWSPPKSYFEETHLARFIANVNKEKNTSLSSFNDIHDFSVNQVSDFWRLASDYLDIQYTKEADVICDDTTNMPYTKWFKGARLNYAQNLLRNRSNDLAIYEVDESGLLNTLTWLDLYKVTSQWVQFFQDNGIVKGDRVAGILPNNLTAIVAMLAATSLGAVWSSYIHPILVKKGFVIGWNKFNQNALSLYLLISTKVS